MWTKEKLEQFCREYGFKPSNTKSELKELPNLLNSDEKLEGLLEGALKDIGGNKFNGLGLVIVTNKRIIFFRKSIIGTITKEEMSLKIVTSAAYRKGLIFASIAITSASNDAIINQCDKKLAEKFNSILTNLIHNSHSEQNLTTNVIHEDISTRIEKLFELKQKGILTEDEFKEQKAKILAE